MRFAVVFTTLALAGLSIAGCGSSAKTTTAPVGPTYTYSQALKTSFMSNCVKTSSQTGKNSRAYSRKSCACALRYLEDQVPEQQLRLLSTSTTAPTYVTDAVRSSIQLCE